MFNENSVYMTNCIFIVDALMENRRANIYEIFSMCNNPGKMVLTVIWKKFKVRMQILKLLALTEIIYPIMVITVPLIYK